MAEQMSGAQRGGTIWAVATALVLVLLVALAYVEAPRNGFHLDDMSNVVLHKPLHPAQLSVAELGRAVSQASLPTRPLANLTLALDWWRGGGSPAAFQVTNVALHAAAAAAVFALFLTLLRLRSAAAGWPPVVAAGAAAAIWALHPIQVQAVTYVVQRMTVLAGLFVVAAVLCYLLGRTARRARALWLAASALCVLLAAASKERAWVVAPALLLAAEYSAVRGERRLLAASRDFLLLGVPAAAALWLLVDLTLLHGPIWDWVQRGYAQREFTLGQRLLSQPGVIAFHLSQLLWPLPHRFAVEHDWPLDLAWQHWRVLGGFALVLAWAAAGLRLFLYPARRLIGFLLLWPLIALSVESGVVALEIIFEHRMYLPSVGLAGLLALGLERALARPTLRPWTLAAAGLVAALMLWATRERVPQWRDEVTLYEQAVGHAPTSARAWNQLGLGYEARRRPREALAAYSRAIELKPNLKPALHWVNRGNVRQAFGDLDGALRDYEQALMYNPDLALARNNRGLLYLRLGRNAEALADFERVVALAPDNAQGWSNRGTLFYQAGRDEDARRDFEKAVALEPKEAVAHHYLGRLASRRGAQAQAAAHFAAACRLGIRGDCGAGQR